MHVVVRVEVRGGAAEQVGERVELAEHLALYGDGVGHVEVIEVPVQADRESGVLAGELDCASDPVALDHEARAGHDAVGVGLDDPAVDAVGGAEVVGVDVEDAVAQRAPSA
jgi:hypothetical protein